MPMACRRYCTHGLTCFLLLVPLLFLSCLLRDELVAAVDVRSSLPLDKAQEVIMIDLSSVVGEGWSSNTDFCTWIGVACSRSGSSSSLVVTNITLSNYGISDPSVFSSLCLLDTLLSLDLSRSNLTNLGDKFSTTYCRMKEGLLLLNLSSNQLLSDKFSEFCGLPQLEVLDLSFNLFLFTDGNLSPDLSSFPRLRILNLSHNHLSGSVPSDLSQLSELGILDLSYNDLSGKVPSSLGSLQSLAQLVLSHNHLSGLFLLASAKMWKSILMGILIS